jgi:hypothetical protein
MSNNDDARTRIEETLEYGGRTLFCISWQVRAQYAGPTQEARKGSHFPFANILLSS